MKFFSTIMVGFSLFSTSCAVSNGSSPFNQNPLETPQEIKLQNNVQQGNVALTTQSGYKGISANRISQGGNIIGGLMDLGLAGYMDVPYGLKGILLATSALHLASAFPPKEEKIKSVLKGGSLVAGIANGVGLCIITSALDTVVPGALDAILIIYFSLKGGIFISNTLKKNHSHSSSYGKSSVV